jgi:hypothetical protein
MSRAAFDALTQHPAFRKNLDDSLHLVEVQEGGYCTLGSLSVDGKSWRVELYYVEDGGGYRVHSFAIQPPATVALGELLPECGLWEGTLAGYGGPPIERTTTPLRRAP